MNRRTHYTVRYKRAAAWWEAKVEGAALETAGRSLSQARKHVRMMLVNEGIDGAELVDDVRLPPAMQRALDRVKQARAAAARAAEVERTATSEALQLLLGRGRISVRDAAELLELGRSRVCELAVAEPRRS